MKRSMKDYFSASSPKKALVPAEGKGPGSKQSGKSVMDQFGLRWEQSGKELYPGTRELAYLNGGPGSTLKGCSKIAGFDIDYTIIATKSGKVFPVDKNDWQILFKEIPGKLKELVDDGYRVVFFTNQAGIETRKQLLEDMQSKFVAIVNKIDLPISVILATGRNYFRKPNTEMWDFFVENCNSGVKVDLEKCFYVGDAAGRPKDWAPKKRKDFSCSDRMFAANIGIKFYTPEEYFLNFKPQLFDWHSVDPHSLLKADSKSKLPLQYHLAEQEMIVLVGLQGSGKSTFCKDYLQPNGYVVVNRDTLNTQAKCLKVAEDSIKSGKSVVIDNTNPGIKDREAYVNIAKKHGIKARCFHLTTSVEVAHHLNYVRQNLTKGKTKTVPPVAYMVFKKNLVPPTMDEGFLEVREIKFSPTFENEKHKQLFLQWTD